MPRIKLTIAYDGTDFVGWQRQADGDSVQQILEEKLEVLLKQPVTLHGSGRTDAGVHAQGMVAHFDSPMDLPLKAYRDGLNGLLPTTIAVQNAEEVSDDFHARFQAKGKWYRYSLFCSPVRSPQHCRTSWHLKRSLDHEAMAQAAGLLVGTHDFAAFRNAQCDAQTTIREIYSVALTPSDQELHIDVQGSGFLRNMVRMIAGTLVEVGQGKRTPDQVAEMLRSGHSDQHRLTAPPQGLSLMRVWY